ncbi:hypothetical protein Cfla_0764 [Cellulomonas flavigena DSM 20109]|uniref:Polysaccharide pyruvyl transferase domain-containing protein n=1 Tax=Cellulomonas flavigena (strain ATCC 482 / DSM 20109 / BCRC 11376 / JCM 18109 / NBRC 3775 / NCIMB 8073 / NRS 134) TaxID=446466 RepID=D5UJF2_CELFN|nr:polysaccharide pyruvyl transferase family protein [Cellulomonas flavigena]ADG73675.1 hypothetical protein Cfla_0764 [Cellulomonas flavigena DSM 20109]
MTIGFTGPFSDVNFGDYAMLVNNVRTLGATEYTVFAYDRQFLDRIQQHYLSDHRVSVIEVHGLDRLVGSEASHRRLTPIEVLRAVTNLDEVMDAVSRLDVLYVNGGGYINSLWSRPHRLERLLTILTPVLAASAVGTPVVYTANGFGPIRGDEEFFSAMLTYAPEARYGVRDRLQSPAWLSRLGIDGARISVLPDDLLFIDESLLPPQSPPISDPYVVVETYLAVEELERHVDQFTRFATTMRERHGLKIVVLPFNLGYAGVDQANLLRKAAEGIEVVDITSTGFLPIEEAVRVVRGAELVIASRYHALILALGAGTPFVSVLKDVLGDKQYYFTKNAGALDGALHGQPHDPRDYFATDLGAAFDDVAKDFLGITSRQRMTFAAASARTFPALRAARSAHLGLGG